MPKSLNDITKADLEEIKKLASIFLTPRDISMIMEIETEKFIEYCDGPPGTSLYNAFQGGRLISETELRTSVIKLAKSGSSPAQTMALQMLNDSKMKMLDR